MSESDNAFFNNEFRKKSMILQSKTLSKYLIHSFTHSFINFFSKCPSNVIRAQGK